MSYEINTAVSRNEKERYGAIVSGFRDTTVSDREYMGKINQLNRRHDLIAAPHDKGERNVVINLSIIKFQNRRLRRALYQI